MYNLKSRSKKTLLFTIYSNDANIKADDSNRQHLTFYNIREIHWFTNHPLRYTGHIHGDRFISLWNEGLDRSTAAGVNAAFIGTLSNSGKEEQAILRLSKPLFHYSCENNHLSFEITPISVSPLIAEDYDYPSLFMEITIDPTHLIHLNK